MGDQDPAVSAVARQPGGNWSPEERRIEQLLGRATVERIELLPSGSNYVFAARLIDDEAGTAAAIYKPRRGEAPLHDFPDGTLYRRERAAFVVSEAMGWQIVPPTVVREGPHGIGSFQLYIEHHPRSSYFTLRARREAELRRLAFFDAIVNNADRKGGHCLDGLDGRIWGIDHGLCFHHQVKLRTVIWDFAGDRVDPALLAEAADLCRRLEHRDPALAELDDLLNRREVAALRERVERLLSERTFPLPPPWRPTPWPPL